MSDPQGDLTYIYLPKLLGAPATFTLTRHALEWSYGRRKDRIPYAKIAKVRLSYHPTSVVPRRYLCEIWPAFGPKAQIASASAKNIAEQTPHDVDYLAFIEELHRRLGASGKTRFVAGKPVWAWALAALMLLATIAAAIAIFFAALDGEHLLSSFALGAMAAFLIFQLGKWVIHNQPSAYLPDALPRRVLPDPTS